MQPVQVSLAGLADVWRRMPFARGIKRQNIKLEYVYTHAHARVTIQKTVSESKGGSVDNNEASY